MILYLDTSALVKLYVDEPGSASLREALVTTQVDRLKVEGFYELSALW